MKQVVNKLWQVQNNLWTHEEAINKFLTCIEYILNVS